MFLKNLFKKKADKDGDKAQDKVLTFATTLISRAKSQTGHKMFYCLAAADNGDGKWEVHRRRYMVDNLGLMRLHGSSDFPHARRAMTAEEALARLQEFETDHADRKGRTDKCPNDAKTLTQMEEMVEQQRITAARQAGGLHKHVVLAQRRSRQRLGQAG